MDEPRGHEAHEVDRLTRGRDLTEFEVDCYLADHQTALRHATANVGDEIAEMLRDRLRASHSEPGAEGLREAVQRLEEHNDEESVAEGYSLVRRSDVLALLAATPAADSRGLETGPHEPHRLYCGGTMVHYYAALTDPDPEP